MLAVRMILAAVFAVSAVAKAIAPRRTRTAAADLGVPETLAPVVAIMLPVAEAGVAVLLAVTPTAATGGAVATAMMAGFTALVAGNLARGRRPACACFGALSARAPISASTLVRNAILLASSLAVLIVALLPGPCSAGCYDRSGARDVAVAGGLALIATIAAGAALIHTLSVAVGRLTDRVQALEAAHGRPSSPPRPMVDLPALHHAVTDTTVTDDRGRAVPLTEVLDGPGSTLLVLMSARCSACERLRDRIRAAPPPAGLRVVGVIDRFEADQHAVPGDPLVVVTDGGRIANAAGVQAFPSAVVLDGGLRPIGDVLTGTTEIRRLLDGHIVGAPALTRGVGQHV